MAAQQTFQQYDDGGVSNADRLRAGPTDRQAPIDAEAHQDASLDIPETAGPYERVPARSAGEIVAWTAGPDRVAVVQTVGTGDPYEVIGADSSRPNPGRWIITADARSQAINCALAYMRGEAQP